eukprot:jgi/Undpi1/251/HiC_scaffold_1.g00248.m1
MRSAITTLAVGVGLVSCVSAVAPTYSCFDPPGEGQTNPLGEGMEDVVEDECCEALIDESDVLAGRLVIWDPVNCNHGPGDLPITEALLCRAHDTDGCRFCHESCDGFQGLCLTCSDVSDMLSQTAGPTASPTASPTSSSFYYSSSGDTPAPFGLFPNTRSPMESPGIERGGFNGDLDGCQCLDDISETEAEILAAQGKTLVCDPTCVDGTDLIWGVMNCNYFALGQDCRACSHTCEETEDGTWLDDERNFCKPCSAILPSFFM